MVKFPCLTMEVVCDIVLTLLNQVLSSGEAAEHPIVSLFIYIFTRNIYEYP